MDLVSALASAVVGLVLVFAGGAKLADRRRWAADAEALGSPPAATLAVPWVELGLGAALVVQIARPVAALAAAVMFVVFSVAIVNVLRSGRRPRCACFGSWSASALGPGHLVRNAALITLSVVAAF